MVPLPPVLIEVCDRWVSAGCPESVASSWRRDRWQRRGLRAPPELLDAPVSRETGKEWAGRVSPGDLQSAKDAFLVSMIWGYGPVPHGPYRTQRVMEQPGFDEALRAVTDAALSEGGVAAYRLVHDRRFGVGGHTDFLRYLGPAFGTKYLYFLTAGHEQLQVTPVLDAVVRRWFALNAPDVDVQIGFRWEGPDRYARYVDTVQDWGVELQASAGRPLAPDEVEFLVFAHQNAVDGGKWQDKWLPRSGEMEPELLLDMLGRRLTAAGLGDEAAGPLEQLGLLVERAATHQQ